MRISPTKSAAHTPNEVASLSTCSSGAIGCQVPAQSVKRLSRVEITNDTVKAQIVSQIMQGTADSMKQITGNIGKRAPV